MLWNYVMLFMLLIKVMSIFSTANISSGRVRHVYGHRCSRPQSKAGLHLSPRHGNRKVHSTRVHVVGIDLACAFVQKGT